MNVYLNHASLSSGIVPFHYSCFCKAIKFWVFSIFKRNFFFNKYNLFVQEKYEESISTALLEEVGMHLKLDSIKIITNGRHGWRKNTKDTSVVVIGNGSHKVSNCLHVTTADTTGSRNHCQYENPMSSPVTPCVFTVIHCESPVSPCTPCDPLSVVCL